MSAEGRVVYHGAVSSGHSHGGVDNRGRLVWALGLSLTVLVIEVIGGIRSGSLALLADAGHMLTDVAGILIALAAMSAGRLPATPSRTFGYRRIEVLAAGVNALLLFAVAGWIGYEAWSRWQAPPDIASGSMLAFASVGLVANIAGLLLLRRGARDSINIKGAYLEMWGDLLGSIAVIVGAIAISATGFLRIDPLVSVLVALMILPRAWDLLREVIRILIEATPKDLDLESVREHWLSKPFVLSVHDMHAWTITSGLPVMSAHVVVRDDALAGGLGPMLEDLRICLDGHFSIEHSTIQIEPEGHAEVEQHLHA